MKNPVVAQATFFINNKGQSIGQGIKSGGHVELSLWLGWDRDKKYIPKSGIDQVGLDKEG